MKKIICILILLITSIGLLGSTVALAAEVTEGIGTLDPGAEAVLDAANEENVFTRLYEAFCDNATNVFTLGGSTALFILGMIFKKRFGVSSEEIKKSISKVEIKETENLKVQSVIASNLNEMVDSYNEVKELYLTLQNQIKDAEKHLNKVLESAEEIQSKFTDGFAVMFELMDKQILQNSAVMEVLSSISANNKILPQGIKDFVALKRTESAKLAVEADALIHKDEGTATDE